MLFDEQVSSHDFRLIFVWAKIDFYNFLDEQNIFYQLHADGVTLFIMVILSTEFPSNRFISWSYFNVTLLSPSICHQLQDDYNESDKFVYFDSELFIFIYYLSNFPKKFDQ